MRLETIGSTPAAMIRSLEGFRSPYEGEEKNSASRHHGAVLADQRRLDDLVVLRHREFAGLGIEREREEVDHIARVERRGVGRDPSRQVAEADDLDAVPGDDLVELRALDFAALLDREIDDDRAR